MFTLTLWTNDAERAGWADRAGVERIGLDLESFGKAERQRGLGTWLSGHGIEDLPRVRDALTRAALFVRADPWNSGSHDQIETLIGAGVEVIMTPNFTSADEIARFADVARGRVEIVPLIERISAVACIADLPAYGVREVHVGLNDLSIDLDLKNRLAVLAAPLMTDIASRAHDAGLRIGFGGLGRALDTSLPIHSDLVYAQHARLGSTGALLARSFFNAGMDEAVFAGEIARLHERLGYWRQAGSEELEAARVELEKLTAEADF